MKVATRPTMSKFGLTKFAFVVAAVGMGSLAPRAVQAEVQPHMTAALASLQNARRELAKGSTDKGGHRVAAMASIDRAIAQVRQGIAYDNRNSKKTMRPVRRKIKM